MRSTLRLAVAIVLVGCATGGSSGSSKNDLTISIGEENVRVGERTFAIGDAEAMRAGLAGACADGCEQVEIRAIPMARYDAMLASYRAGVENEAQRILLRIATSDPVALSSGDAGSQSATCPAEVVLRHKSIEVYVNGEILPPDPECASWSATICDSGKQDPMKRDEFNALRSVVKDYSPRFVEQTCLFVESEMPAMLVGRLIQSVQAEAKGANFSLRRDRRRGALRENEVTEAMVAQGDKLTACYDKELEKSRTPMEAVVRMLIGPGGEVLRTELRDKAMTTPRFEACLLQAVKGLQFPRPDHGGMVEITYPLRFSPRPGLSDG